jgi:pimeloyl-ACP methyl ester carboxylesterase
MVPAPWQVTNDEKLAHVEELKKMVPLWANITVPCTYIYGEKDNIVPPVNVEFAKKMLVNAQLHVISLPEENHFIPWTRQDTITNVIMRYLAKSDSLHQ